MCGVSGILGSGCQVEDIRKMVLALSHRGPNASDTYLSDDARCALGHNRLSIIDLSDNGIQPMASADGRYVIVFNGEIYNYRELKDYVGPYPYKSNSDTEVLLAGFVRFGPPILDRLVGMFSFAIWDSHEKTLFCARDRLGIKPFHYAIYKGRFYFASEIKALLAAGVPASPDWDIWSAYLRYGIYDHSGNTFFHNIHSLSPGHSLKISANSEIELKSYWDLDASEEGSFPGSLDEAADKLNTLMNDSVRLRMRSDVPLGVNLSGGLDSSSLLAYIERQSGVSDRLTSFTYAFDGSAYDETDFVKKVPKKLEWNHHHMIVRPEVIWDDIDDLMYHQEAPFGGVATLAYHSLHRDIRKVGVTVVLEGQGVDECLGGYAYYKNIETQKDGIYQDGTSFLRTDCLSSEILGMGSNPPIFSRPYSSPLSNALYKDLKHTKLPRVLRMNDRLSMAFGLELREPFLDHRVVEFCFTLPDPLKIDSDVTKRTLRHAMKDMLPDDVRNVSKRAVVTPQREWMRKNYKSEILDILHSSEFRDIQMFDVRKSIDAYEEFCKGRGENAFFIWQWINAYSWMNVFQKSYAVQKSAVI